MAHGNGKKHYAIHGKEKGQAPSLTTGVANMQSSKQTGKKASKLLMKRDLLQTERLGSPLSALLLFSQWSVYCSTRHVQPYYLNLIYSSQVSAAYIMGDWQAWPFVAVRLRYIPEGVTTRDIHAAFAQYGEIVYIEQFEDQRGVLNGEGRISFEPPPMTPFWRLNTYTISYDSDGSRTCKIRLELGPPPKFTGKTRSKINPRVFYPHKMTFNARSLDFGVTSTGSDIMIKASIRSSPSSTSIQRVRLETDFRRKTLTVYFPHAISLNPQERGERVRQYKAVIDASQIKQLAVTTLRPSGTCSGNSVLLTIPLRHPPFYHLKSNDVAPSLDADRRVWSSNDQWHRITHIMQDLLLPQDYTVGLANAWSDPAFIDIGRWTTLRLDLDCDSTVIAQFLCALNDLNIDIRKDDKPVELRDGPVLLPPENHPVRHHDRYPPPHDPYKSTSALHALRHLAGDNGGAGTNTSGDGGGNFVDLIIPYLPFNVQYQLEVCISRHILCEYELSHQFFAKLRALNPQRAQFALEYMADRGERVCDPLAVLDDTQSRLYYPSPVLPNYCTVMRKATVTPTTIYFSTPAVECTNRVTRKWHSHIDRFLRVQFTDELFRGKIKTNATMDIDLFIFKRVYLTLLNGIRIGDRHYKFLAFGNSQIRECGAYFFCETDQLTCEAMRGWMGDFDHIRVVAKFAARLGQCFSTTREVRSIRAPVIKLIDDIERDGFCFTDGVGKISPLLARIVAEDMSHEMAGDEPPSAVQFRMGGCKGVLAVWPEAKGLEVHVRRSQEKFKAQFNGLEIIRCARYATATLNRQTITILTCLGVPEQNFLDMVRHQVAEYASSMQDQYAAVGLLERHIDENQIALLLKELINYGFMDPQVQEPVVLTFLQLWRAWSMKNLREKARVVVDQSAFVLGCVDETGTLRGHSVATESRSDSKSHDDLPQIFLQIPDRQASSGFKVVEGVCIVGRNPSLHPGDIRVVQAVDCPVLHHLKNVVVFPSTGDKDVPSMLSGGDLDGDDFFVIWDPKLIPPEWNYPPMDHRAPQPETLQRPVSASDLIKFFVKYIRNDCLPLIALSHLANADNLQGGAKNPKCLELAALHSKAVDYVKTGDPAHLRRDLRARKWPHFMSSNDKKSNTYHSATVLGQIYDATSEISFKPLYENEFDKRILAHSPADDGLLRKARALKSRYDDAMRRLMAQREVATEFEIFTAFPLSKPTVGSAYKFSEDIGREAGLLKQAFRDEVYKEMGGRHFDIIAPMVAAMYKVTAEEAKIVLQEHRRNRKVGAEGSKDPNPKSMPIITFPWIFHWVLGRLATGMVRSRDVVTEKVYGVKAQEKPTPAERGQDDQAAATALASPKTSSADESQDGEEKLDEAIAARLPDGQIVHRGEVLNLFNDDQEDSNSSYDEDQSHSGDPTSSCTATAIDSDEAALSCQDQQEVLRGGENGEKRKEVGNDEDPFAAVFSLARSSLLTWATQKTETPTTEKTKDDVPQPEELPTELRTKGMEVVVDAVPNPESDEDVDESHEEETLMDRFGKTFNFGNAG
ncbi:RdRP-domain-containing protein [Sodiomyces alkalinus F11]|uniref:RdRP-domain-containing protein n=1 Tax=Sodiomyces alkalinus (strain CBS 110278 / VKM F-3762 / F11) TaxID=1314773 RepID=A0A3N2PJI5_SODAK|nr:RdRP-domain-containing protein [Sodiomyces alkalinus F11]ROT34698.1 RdRP-domain-containing protein [Sodiomyces alkalinus F11]